jgi:hypothetical protein
MDDRPTLAPEKPDQLLDCRNNGFETRDVIPEGLTKPSRLDEVALHVDDNESRAPGIEGEIVGLGFHRNHGSMPRHVLPDGGAVGFRARYCIGDFALRHDSNAICKLENLIQIFGKEKNSGPSIPLLYDLRAYVSD